MLAFLWVSSQLFLKEQTNEMLTSVKNYFIDVNESIENVEVLRVLYPDEPVSLETTQIDPITRQRLVNIYEPIVRTDRDLNFQPALAISWGLINDNTWEFRLRPNVYFHDGTSLDFADIEASLDRAKTKSDSQQIELLSSIAEVVQIDEFRFRIETFEPDPLILQKLAQIMIIPSAYKDSEELPVIGTGSYQFSEWKKGDRIELKRYDSYWGTKPLFENVEMISRGDKAERVRMLVHGEADFLAFVPQELVEEIKSYGFEIATIPSLEVQFLILNMQSKYFSDREAREAFSLAIDQESLVEELGENVLTVTQFVSSGVFGFNPEIVDGKYDAKRSKEIFVAKEMTNSTIHFHLPKGLDLLGEHVRKQLSDAGINVIVSYLDSADFVKSIFSGKADIYFLAFKSDLGDSSEFLNSIAYSNGDFNIGNYENEMVDKLIESALIDLDEVSRRDSLQEIMRIIVEEDIIGVPLFEYETVYAFSDFIEMRPRIDGLIYFNEISIK